MGEPIIVVATKNKGKIRELHQLLEGAPVKIMSLADFGPTPDVIEDQELFEDNAYKKALHYARVLGIPALADDSGLTVEALGGAPGVFSARWAGEDASDQDRVKKLLGEMEGKVDRRAAFVCALVLAMPTGPALTWVGRVEGEITLEPDGENGFGYDPVFLYPPAGKTFARLSAEEKNRVSHRGQALQEFRFEIDKVLTWMAQRENEVQPPHPH